MYEIFIGDQIRSDDLRVASTYVEQKISDCCTLYFMCILVWVWHIYREGQSLLSDDCKARQRVDQVRYDYFKDWSKTQASIKAWIVEPTIHQCVLLNYSKFWLAGFTQTRILLFKNVDRILMDKIKTKATFLFWPKKEVFCAW